MNLEQIWQQNSGNDDDLDNLLAKGNFSKLQSQLPLNKLRTNLLIGIVWAVLITIGYVIVFFLFSIWQVYISLGVLIAFNSLIMLDSWKLYRKTPATIVPSNSLKEELTTHYNSFRHWWAVQQKVSLFVYPIAAAGGFILGGVMGSGKAVETFLYSPKMLGILGITIIVMVPLCFFGARWMFNYAYGRHMKKLKTAIDELSERA